MLLKRSIVLAAGVLLFIAAFLIYFEVSNMQMEARFRAERKKFNVDGVNLTAAPDASSPAPPPSSPTPDSAPDTNAAPAPAATDSTSTPAPAPDANSAPATPDTNSAPVSPDTNSAPMTPAPSTMNEPRGNSSPFQPASYRPADGAGIPFADLVMGQVTNPAPSVPTPAANPATDAASAPTAAPVTNFAPARVVEPALSDAKGATVLIQKTTPAPPALPATGESSVIVLLYHQFKPAGIPIPAKFQWTLNQDVFESEMKYIRSDPLSEARDHAAARVGRHHHRRRLQKRDCLCRADPEKVWLSVDLLHLSRLHHG